VGEVRKLGVAHAAGLEKGDVVVACEGKEGLIEYPLPAEVNRTIRQNTDRDVSLTVRKPDGQTVTTEVRPEPSGAVDATFNLVADDMLRIAEVIPEVSGRPTPAAQAGLSRGALITAVNGEPVSKWRDLIDAFRRHAGSTVELTYKLPKGEPKTAAMAIPHCLPTLLGVGPEARIVSIDGQRTVTLQNGLEREEVSVGYRKGMKAALAELVGRKNVPVEYRENALAPIKTASVDVTEDMVDPWLARIAFGANIDVAAETALLKGKNALDAIRIGIHKTYYFCFQVYKTMERMFFTRSVGIENVSGPLGIIDVGGKFARAGLIKFIFFMAIISANLAVINFLPMPIVDGGLMVFLIIEKIKGSPVSLRVQVATQVIGLFLIIGAFLFVTFNDAMRLWG
jgi:regulator of sigma E protease